MKRIILGLISILVLSGCTSKETSELEKSYENMVINNTIESYQLDLRIYGSYNNETISEVIKIDNYKNTQFKIEKINNNSKTIRKNREEIVEEDNALYIIDGKKYRFKEGTYVEVEEDFLYTNPNVYLQGLKSIKESKELKSEKIGDVQYKVYEIVISKENTKNILKDSILKDVELIDDVVGKVWLNSDNQVYKIIYYLTNSIEEKNKLEISASYSRINSISEIKNTIRIG